MSSNGSAYSAEALAPLGVRVSNSSNGVSSEFPPRGYVELRQDEMALVRYIQQNDSTVQIAKRISLAELMAGGILFRVGSQTLNGPNANGMQQIWDRFARQVMEMYWLYGFVAMGVRDNDEYIGIPYAVDLQTVRVFVKRSYDRSVSYMLYHVNPYRPTMPSPPELIRGLTIFEIDPPTVDGRLDSIMMKVWRLRDTLNHLESAEKKAVDQNSNPMTYLESTEAPNRDSSEVFRPGSDARSSLMASVADTQNRMAVLQASLARWANSRPTGDGGDSTCVRASMPFNVSDTTNMGAHADNPLKFLPPGVRVARAPEAKEPSNLTNYKLWVDEQIGGLFFTPRGMWAEFSASRSSNNPEARLMFNRGQQNNKTVVVIPLLTSMFRRIYGQSFSIATAFTHANILAKRKKPQGGTVSQKSPKRAKAEGRTTQDDNAQYNDVDSDSCDQDVPSMSNEHVELYVVLPGRPPEKDIIAMYEEGLLKHEAVVDLLSKLHSIPRDFFHAKKAQLPPAALNGKGGKTQLSKTAKEDTSTDKSNHDKTS